MTKNEIELTTLQVTLNIELDKRTLRNKQSNILKFVNNDWCLELIINKIKYHIFIYDIDNYIVYLYRNKSDNVTSLSKKMPKSSFVMTVINLLYQIKNV